MKHKSFLIIIFLFVLAGKLSSQEIVSEQGMISCANVLAAEAGIEIMKNGGNAVDAAIASAFVLSVVEPYASGIGGGGFLIVKPKDGKALTIDYREKAPANVNAELYYKDSLSFKKLTQTGAHSVGVPGVLSGLDLALKNYGTMELGDVLKPAIKIAEEGYPISKKMYDLIVEKYDLISSFDKMSNTFLDEGFPPDEGSLLVNKKLAETYKAIAADGIETFYSGQIASEIINEIVTNGGVMNPDDLKNYSAASNTPVVGNYRGYQIISTAPPSGGGTHLIELLNIMENYDVGKMQPDSFEYLHLLAEAIKIIQWDKKKYMADPEFVEVPSDKIINKNYAASISKNIIKDTVCSAIPELLSSSESGSTTHISAVDKEGNMIAVTQSINLFFGSGLIAGNTGIMLNNHLGNFDNRPNQINSIAGGKKPVSSIAPTIILKDGKPFLIIGTPGGSRIIGTMAQVIINMIDFNMSLSEAIEYAKIHFEKSTLHMEKRFDESVINDLKEAGHKIELHSEFDKYFGGVNAIRILENGKFIGASDSRRGGKALGF